MNQKRPDLTVSILLGCLKGFPGKIPLNTRTQSALTYNRLPGFLCIDSLKYPHQPASRAQNYLEDSSFLILNLKFDGY